MEHLLGGAFKQPPATASKEGVTAKQFRAFAAACWEEKGDVITGVARNLQHLHWAVEQQPLISPAQPICLKRNASTVGGRSPHLSARPTAEQLWGAADVVVMVMGLQHHSELQLLGLQGRHHRFSHRWINNGRLAAGAIHQHKHIVVPQHG